MLLSYHKDIGMNTAGMRYLLIFFLILFPGDLGCYAGEIFLSPSISGDVRYDDNISFTRVNSEHDFVFTVSPGAELIYRTDTAAFKTGIRGDFLRYKKYDGLDQKHYAANLGGNVYFSDRFSLNGSAARSKDSTLDSELSETGILTQRSDVIRENLGLGFSYALSEKGRIALNSSYSSADYESDHNVDYDGSSVSFTFSRIIEAGTGTLFLQPYYSENSSSFSSAESMGLYAGWSSELSETWSVSLSIGARRTKNEYYIWVEKDWGWLADISIDKTWETWSTGLELTRDLKFSSFGEPIETDKIDIRFRKRLSEKFRCNFSGGITSTESTGIGSRRDTMYYSFSNSLDYMVQKDLLLRFSYIYSVNHNSLRTVDKSVDRNRLSISLNYSFKEMF